MAALAVAITFLAVQPYLTGDPATSKLPLNPDTSLHYLSVVAHALPGGVALLVGPVQFIPRVRARYPRLHRTAGWVYVTCVVAGGATAISAATLSPGGYPAQLGFYFGSVAWLYTLLQAVRAIRRGDIEQHRIWMIRNYALTLLAVTLRVVFFPIGFSLVNTVPSLTEGDVYTMGVWGSLVLNTLLTEYVILHRSKDPARRAGRPGRRARVQVGASAGMETLVAVPPQPDRRSIERVRRIASRE
jgi:uncharacterized membrane protein